jgi:hypothetical protein
VRRPAASLAVALACLLSVACSAGNAGGGGDDAAPTATAGATAEADAMPAPVDPSTPVASDAPVADGGGSAATGAPGGRAYVDSVDVMVLESFPLQVRVGIAGNLSDPCTHLAAPRVQRDGDTFRVALPTTRDEGMCAQVLQPFETTVELPVEGLPRGTYTVDVEGQTATFTFDRDNKAGEP